jgi:hypothetical protein
MTDRPKRKKIPLAVKLAACERKLCELLGCERIEYNHEPALIFRDVTPDGKDYVPAQNDPAYIDPISAEAHSRHTNGTAATSYGSVKHGAAKVKRIRGETKQGPVKKIPQRANPWPPKGSRHLASRPMRKEVRR